MLSTLFRGIVVMGNTNSIRTQITEGFIRRLTDGDIFVASCGVYQDPPLHPLAVAVMEERGIDISGQMAKATSAVDVATFDVRVSIDVPVGSKGGASGTIGSVDGTGSGFGEAVEAGGRLGMYELSTGTGSPHWVDRRAQFETTRSAWKEISVSRGGRKVTNENSMRRFQDHYAGEPLYQGERQAPGNSTVTGSGVKIARQWVVESPALRRPMETREQQLERFRAVRDECEQLAEGLVRDLHQYGSQDGGARRRSSSTL